jgi:hypothetical protein
LPDFLASHPGFQERYNDFEDVPEDWSHEMSSLQMIDAALAELGLAIDLDHLDEPLRQIGDGVEAKSLRVFRSTDTHDNLRSEDILTSRDWVFVKECILGKPLPEVTEMFDRYDFIGRTDKTKEWLHDIVNNRHSGLDVDKMDYFSRDRKRALGNDNKDFKMIYDARVAPGECPNPEKCFKCNGEARQMHYMISYPNKRVPAVLDFFKKRFTNHEIVYQHKKTAAAEATLIDILCLADSSFRLYSYDGQEFPISRAVLKSDFLKRLDDNVISLIEHSSPKEYPQEEMNEARDLIRCLRTHQLYKCAIDYRFNLKNATDEKLFNMKPQEIAEGVVEEFLSYKEQRQPGDASNPNLTTKDFVVKPYNIHYGRKEQNPVLCVRFFDSMNEKLTGPIEVIPEAFQIKEDDHEDVLPQRFSRAGLRVYSRRPEKQYREIIHQFFLQWVEKQGAARPTPMARFGGIQDLDDDSDDDGNYAAGAVMLSQESQDDD